MSSGFSIDLVEILFTLFWLFFFALVFYLHRESKREGYPLISDRSDSITVQGFPSIPSAKEYRLPHGGTQLAPRNETPQVDVPAEPAHRAPGSPLVPTGNPIGANIGTGSYARRSDTPFLTPDGKPRIVPLRVQPEFYVDKRDVDPRGMSVHAADDVEVGTVKDAWIDLAEPQIYYLEVAGAGRTFLVPFDFAEINKRKRVVKVNALYSHQFANVPTLQSPDQITPYEEDRICGYFGGGLLYADDKRAEPFL